MPLERREDPPWTCVAPSYELGCWTECEVESELAPAWWESAPWWQRLGHLILHLGRTGNSWQELGPQDPPPSGWLPPIILHLKVLQSSRAVLLAGDQVCNHMSPWGHFTIQTTIVHLLIPPRKCVKYPEGSRSLEKEQYVTHCVEWSTVISRRVVVCVTKTPKSISYHYISVFPGWAAVCVCVSPFCVMCIVWTWNKIPVVTNELASLSHLVVGRCILS